MIDNPKESKDDEEPEQSDGVTVDDLVAAMDQPEHAPNALEASAAFRLSRYWDNQARMARALQEALNPPYMQALREMERIANSGPLAEARRLQKALDDMARGPRRLRESMSLMGRFERLHPHLQHSRGLFESLTLPKYEPLLAEFRATARASQLFSPTQASVLSQTTRDMARLYDRVRSLSPESAGRLADATERLVHEAPKSHIDGQTARKIVLATVGKLQGAIDLLATNPEERFKIDDRLFEELIAELLEREGYSVELTQKSRDGGRDVIATSDGFLGRRVVQIECKRYAPNKSVGIAVVQRVIGVVESYDANSGLVVTTADFSKPARKIERLKPHLLQLRNGEEFIGWLRRVRSAAA